jgi:mRNA interferase MazF
MPLPTRGEVWIVDLGYAAKIRPAVVLSVPNLSHDRALVTLIPHTTAARGSRFEVSIPKRFLAAGVFDTQNPVTIPESKLVRRLGALSAEELVAVETSLRLWLGL